MVTCGYFTPEGGFAALPQFDRDRLLVAWQEAVFALYLVEGKIKPEFVENMRTWNHSGLSVDSSVLLRAGDQAGTERLVQSMTGCPFSLSRLVKVTETGPVVYKAEQQACRAFPDQQGDGIASGPKRNFQIFSPLDFLAPPPRKLGTQHIPAKDSHLIRCDGWVSNMSRGLWKKADVEVSAKPSCQGDASDGSATCYSQTWVMLIKRVYEIDPLTCPHCGSPMKVVAFIEPPQDEVVEKILRRHQSAADHRRPKLRLCARSVPVGGLWQASAPRAHRTQMVWSQNSIPLLPTNSKN